ncbi:hypothetical protein V5799_021901 [Amblyomma americanum]|uniref:Uncharacterized protein n=1 Tax=Amblyomma americanum TaxID=6943 RepID=A0AAQ4FM16_AMBAM
MALVERGRRGLGPYPCSDPLRPSLNFEEPPGPSQLFELTFQKRAGTTRHCASGLSPIRTKHRHRDPNDHRGTSCEALGGHLGRSRRLQMP